MNTICRDYLKITKMPMRLVLLFLGILFTLFVTLERTDCIAVESLPAWAGWDPPRSTPCLSIKGAVRQSVSFSVEDLARFQSVQVQLSEITKDETYLGAFYYRGVPLRSLLELAGIRKEDKSTLHKPIDVAIALKDNAGKQTVLSWGEVFVRTPEDVIIAISSTPIMPGKMDCISCHKPDFFEPKLELLKRSVGFPKLVMARDFYADRCLENLAQIELIISETTPLEKKDVLFSSNITIADGLNKVITITELSAFSRKAILAKVLGTGRGFHGIREYEGAPLKEILLKAGVTYDPSMFFLLSAPDGYRSLISAGELFLNPVGDRVIVGDRLGEKPIEKEGRFQLVIPDDGFADRWVKALEKIEVIRLTQTEAKNDQR